MLRGHKGASIIKGFYVGSLIGTLCLTRGKLRQQFTCALLPMANTSR
jgi:hypothetical protein